MCKNCNSKKKKEIFKCPSVGGRLNNLHNSDYFLALKKTRSICAYCQRKELQDISLTEKKQTPKVTKQKERSHFHKRKYMSV